MVISQGDVIWAELPEPEGSGPGFRRPVLVIQGNELNRSRLATVLCVPLTSNLKWVDAPGNVLLRASSTGLPRDSVANTTQLHPVNREVLAKRAGHLTAPELASIIAAFHSIIEYQP